MSPNSTLLGTNSGRRSYTLFQGHSGPVYSTSFCPFGDYVLSSSSDSTGSLDFLEVASELKLESLLSLISEISSIEGVVHFSPILMHCIAIQAIMCWIERTLCIMILFKFHI